MTPIRPTGLPNAAPAQGADAARNAAQRAFFQAAMGQAQPLAARPEATGAAPAQRVQRMPAALPADPPERILRPGSLLDIRV